MRRQPFGRTGPAVPVIGQGTWYLDEGEPTVAAAALNRGLDVGMSHVDTAEMYGEAEPLIAEAIGDRRDEVFLVSKVLPGNASRRGTVEACERSLRRLRTDRLDCYLLHWRGPHPLEETLRGLRGPGPGGQDSVLGGEQLRRRRPRRGAGRRRPRAHRLQPGALPPRGTGDRAFRPALVPAPRRRRRRLQPVRPRQLPGARDAGRPVLAEIAQAHDATPRQVALAALTRGDGVLTIPKASSPAHAAENAGGGSLSLSDAELARIDAAFPRARPRHLPML